MYLLDDSDEKVTEKATAKRQPRKAFTIDFSAPLSAGSFTKAKVRAYIVAD